MTEPKSHAWSDLAPDSPMPGVSRRRVVGAEAMLSRVELAAGTLVPDHSHPNEQFACVLAGRVRFEVGEGSERRELVLGAGEVLHLPSMVPHLAEALADSVVLDVFAPPSEGTGLDERRG